MKQMFFHFPKMFITALLAFCVVFSSAQSTTGTSRGKGLKKGHKKHASSKKSKSTNRGRGTTMGNSNAAGGTRTGISNNENAMPGTGSSEMDHGGMDMPMSMGPITDTGFLRKGIISNMMEIKMSEAARDRGNSAVRKVAAQMIKDHTQMLSDLTSLAGKMGVEVPDESTMSMNTMDDMTSDQFNRTWATQMFVMHKKKVRDLQMAIPKLQDPTLKAAASSALPKVKLHTEMLAKLPRNGSK